MAMVCPKCQGSFEGTMQCPRCGVRLLYQREARGNEHGTVAAGDEKWHQTPLGRTIAGLVLSSGLGFGLLHLFASSLYLMDKEAGGKELAPAVGLGLFVGLQALGVLVGATLAGVGRSKGVAYGVVVGLLHSAIVLAGIRTGPLTKLSEAFVGDLLAAGGPVDQEMVAGVPLRMAVLGGMPLAFLLCGLIGGFIGSRIWKPPVDLSMPTFLPVENRPVQELASSGTYRPPPKVEPSAWTGPVAWLRVMCGIGVAFAGAVMARRIIELIQAFSEGMIRVQDNYQEMIAMREIFAVAMFLGGCVGGATRSNGLKQGLIVGIGAGILQGAFVTTNPRHVSSLPYVILAAFFLAPLGGWFGSNLLPAASSRRK
jgi:hypothetical protein